jgi:hypothetical protein
LAKVGNKVANMKAICVGGGLAGFTTASHAKSPYSLKGMIEPDEPVVLVCHGPPYVMLGETEPEILPEMLEYRIHAVVLTHRADPASPAELHDLKHDLVNHCQRVFGLARGWDKIEPRTRERVLQFASSEETMPQDPEVQTLLGYHSPLTRLAMRVSLEIALRELDSGSRLRTPGANMSLALLLAPAISIGESEPTLNAMTDRLKSGLNSGREALSEFVSQALSQLRK